MASKVPIIPSSKAGFHCGYVGLCGRPNVGKSTLLNRLMGQKLSIVSRKPHTTRWHVLGIKSASDHQLIFMDLPGLSQERRNALNRFMHREVAEGLLAVDTAIFIIEALKWTPADDYVLQNLAEVDYPVFAVINKVDRVKDKSRLLPFIEEVAAKYAFESIVPLSAHHDNTQELEQALVQCMPEQPALFPEDQLSDRHERFFIAELLREQLIRHLGQEVPYRLTVTIEDMKEEAHLVHIHALIWVENKGQKAIVIGDDGGHLKQVASAARQSMQSFLDRRINLKTWVKVRDKWTNDNRSLHEFGYYS